MQHYIFQERLRNVVEDPHHALQHMPEFGYRESSVSVPVISADARMCQGD